MANPTIKVKRSAVSGKIPTTSQIDLGELAINTFDGKVYIEQDKSSVGVGTTVIVINPWNVGTGTNTYNTYFTNGNVGVGSTLPTSKLYVVGDVNVSGVITATTFVGDGSGLTGIVTYITAGSGISVNQNTGNVTITATGGGGESYWTQTDVGIHTLGSVGIGTTNPTSKLTVDGDVNITGVVTATSYNGSGTNLTGIVTSIIAGTGITISQSTGSVTVSTAVTTTEHKILDNISSSFNGSTTQFTLSSSSTNFLNSEITTAARLLISVGGVVQQPDPTQTNGFYISGGTDISTDPIKINFVEAPKAGQVFFGVAFGLTASPTSSFVTAEEAIAYSIAFGV